MLHIKHKADVDHQQVHMRTFQLTKDTVHGIIRRRTPLRLDARTIRAGLGQPSFLAVAHEASCIEDWKAAADLGASDDLV